MSLKLFHAILNTPLQDTILWIINKKYTCYSAICTLLIGKLPNFSSLNTYWMTNFTLKALIRQKRFTNWSFIQPCMSQNIVINHIKIFSDSHVRTLPISTQLTQFSIQFTLITRTFRLFHVTKLSTRNNTAFSPPPHQKMCVLIHKQPLGTTTEFLDAIFFSEKGSCKLRHRHRTTGPKYE